MQYFSKYLNGNNLNTKEDISQNNLFCYVKCWAKTEQGIIFRLSNKIIQVNFMDKTQMVIYAKKNAGVFSGLSLGN
jgi:polo-like kinase 1